MLFGSLVKFTIKGQQYVGRIIGYGNLQQGLDVQTHEYIVLNPEEAHFYRPRAWDETTYIFTEKNENGEEEHVMMNTFHLEWTNVLMLPKLNEFFVDRLQREHLVFRRVYITHKTKDMGTYVYSPHSSKRKVTLQDIEAIPRDGSPHNQRNQELQYRKRFILEKGDFYGFTTPRALRKDDTFANTPVYFNNKMYQEYNIVTGKWETPDHNTAHQLPYSGDLICGTVRQGTKGPYFDKWFVCSEQLMKLATLILDPENESIEDNLQRLKNRLRTNKLEEWMYHNPMAFDEEIEERFHRFRYESTANIPNAYVYIAFLAMLQEPEYVENLNEGWEFLTKCFYGTK